MSEPANDKKLRCEVSVMTREQFAQHGAALLAWLCENIGDPVQCVAVLDTVASFLRDQLGMVRLEINKAPNPAEGGKAN